MTVKSLIRSTNITKVLLEKKIKNGSVVVDATMGNGNDTLFLCQRALPHGKVYAFDIQEDALNRTTALLYEHGYNVEETPSIHLILDSHENLEDYISEDVDVFMYNLGYLPGGNHSLTTTSRSTIKSLESALTKLALGGILSIIVYCGHSSGKEEKGSIELFLETLSNRNYKIFKGSMPYNIKSPPIIYMIEKLKK